MGVKTAVAGAKTNDGANLHFVLQEAIGGYADEAYTTARKLSSTGIVGDNPQINTDTETYEGQMRWFKPLSPQINVASLTNNSAGNKTTYSSDFLRYIKTVRTHGAEKVNLQQVITQQDGLAKIGRDFAETRGQDEHNAILAVLRGVMLSEVLYGIGKAGDGGTTGGLGGQTFENDPVSRRYGFYVDLGNVPIVAANTTGVQQGASRAEGFINAMGMAWKDYEPEYAYLITSPAVMASLRSANLVDQDKVSDGNIDFSTIFGGKLRLIQTRASQGLSSAELTKLNRGSGTPDITGTKTCFIVLPGALAMKNLNVSEDVEIHRDPAAYMGGGTTQIWYRWGYVLAPAGYDWVGDHEAFPSDADYQCVNETISTVVHQHTTTVLTDSTAGVDASVGVWDRKFASALSLGILPVFHS